MKYLQSHRVVNPILWQHNYSCPSAGSAQQDPDTHGGAWRGRLGDLAGLCSKAAKAEMLLLRKL